MLGSLGAPASSTTKTGHHDITERDIFTLVRHCFLYSSVLCYFISCASVQYLALGLTTHTSLSLIRHGLKPSCVHNKKGALDSQPHVIKFTSCLAMFDGSLWVLRLPPPLKLVTMILLEYC